MNVISRISVDMTRTNVGQRVNAVQGDGNTRSVEITLLSGGEPWAPPGGVEAAIAYRQPGGTKGLYNQLADGRAAISITGNVATVILAPQMLTASGTVQASLVFNDAQLNRLTTFPFSVSVTSNPAAGAQKTEDYLRLQWLEDKLEKYLAALKASGVFDGKPGRDGVDGKDGKDGAPGRDGADGKDGTPGADGHTPEYGVDYGTPEQIDGIAQQAAGILQPDISQIKSDLSAEQTAREQADTSLQQEISAKLPKSPADWEPWTAEEQAAARERIGIPGNYELIHDETITEDIYQYTIDKISLKKAIIEFCSVSYTSDKYLLVGLTLDAVVNRNCSTVRAINKNGYISYYYAYCEEGVFHNFAVGPSRPKGSTTNDLNKYTGFLFAETITEIKLNAYTSSEVIPAGCRIKVYGVRA